MMALSRIDAWEIVPPRCRGREHNVPGMMALPPGVYEHTCPDCGRIITFRVTAPEL